MALLGKFEQLPGEVLDYDVDFEDWVTVNGYSSPSCVAAPVDGLTLLVAMNGNNARVTVGGDIVVGSVYTIEVTCTASGRVNKAHFMVTGKAI